MSKLGFPDAYGFQSDAEFNKKLGVQNCPDEAKKLLAGVNKVKNWTQWACYIPIVGTIIGIVRYVIFNNLTKGLDKLAEKDQANKAIYDELKKKVSGFAKGMTIRAIVESFSLGFTLIVTDIIFSMAGKDKKVPAVL